MRAGSGHHGPRSRSLILFFFFLLMFLNIADRQVIGILAEPMRLDLGLSDSELGLVTGLAFALFNSVLGLPLAWVADRWDRARLIGFATVIWSSATAACGAAQGFASLTLARAGLAVGEAAVTPALHALLADLYSPEERARAFGIVQIGVPAGVLAALLVGGALADRFGWRAGFIAVAVPAFIAGIAFLLLVKEPVHERRDGVWNAGGATPVIGQLREIGRSPVLRVALVGAAFANMVLYSLGSWLAVLFIRQFGWSTAEAGLGLGLLIGIAGSAGVFGGGRVASSADEAGVAQSFGRSAVFLLAAAPLLAAAMLSTNGGVAIALLIIPVGLSFAWYAPIYAVIQNAAPEGARALCVAVLSFLNSLIGAGVGPTLIGVLSDLLRADLGAESLRYAMLFIPVASLAAAFVFGWGALRGVSAAKRT